MSFIRATFMAIAVGIATIAAAPAAVRAETASVNLSVTEGCMSSLSVRSIAVAVNDPLTLTITNASEDTAQTVLGAEAGGIDANTTIPAGGSLTASFTAVTAPLSIAFTPVAAATSANCPLDSESAPQVGTFNVAIKSVSSSATTTPVNPVVNNPAAQTKPTDSAAAKSKATKSASKDTSNDDEASRTVTTTVATPVAQTRSPYILPVAISMAVIVLILLGLIWYYRKHIPLINKIKLPQSDKPKLNFRR